jgi:multicomponent K+:H+ antiporter subunit E
MSRFRSWLPRPGLFACLWVTWLMLNQTLHPAHLLLGAALAWLISRWSGPQRLRASVSRAIPVEADDLVQRNSKSNGATIRRKARIAIELFAVVLHDILKANVQVARQIIAPAEGLKPRFVVMRLRVKEPEAIFLLSTIITMTPGTLSADLSERRTQLRIHVLNLDDADALIEEIRRRYEDPILELFR